MKQSFIVEFKNKNEQVLEFFRHEQKTLQAVLKQEKTFFKKEQDNFKTWGHSLFDDVLQDDINIVVYETDFETTPDKIVFKDNFLNFLNEIN